MILVSPENGYMIATQLKLDLDLEPARNQKAAVLRMLILQTGVSERDTVFNGFRTRISELKKEHQLNIRTIKVKFQTQFGKSSSYNKHFLLDGEKPEAVKLYIDINK